MRDIFKKTLEVAKAVEEYSLTPGHSEEDYGTLNAFITRRVSDLSNLDIMEMLQFLQSLSPTFLTLAEKRDDNWDTSTLDLESELNAIYRRSKTVLESDNDAQALQMCISLDTLVRLRERVQNQDRVQQVEDTLLKLLDETAPDLRDKFLAKLQATTEYH
jgi:hypothetical protein